MSEVTRLLDRFSRLAESPRNRELGACWQGEISPAHDSADFYRGIPAPGQTLCLAYMRHAEWQEVMPGYDLGRYYTDPDYYLECYLRKYLYLFEQVGDDRPLRKSIPIFQVTLELSLFGAQSVDHGADHPRAGRSGCAGLPRFLHQRPDAPRSRLLRAHPAAGRP